MVASGIMPAPVNEIMMMPVTNMAFDKVEYVTSSPETGDANFYRLFLNLFAQSK